MTKFEGRVPESEAWSVRSMHTLDKDRVTDHVIDHVRMTDHVRAG